MLHWIQYRLHLWSWHESTRPAYPDVWDWPCKCCNLWCQCYDLLQPVPHPEHPSHSEGMIASITHIPLATFLTSCNLSPWSLHWTTHSRSLKDVLQSGSSQCFSRVGNLYTAPCHIQSVKRSCYWQCRIAPPRSASFYRSVSCMLHCRAPRTAAKRCYKIGDVLWCFRVWHIHIIGEL